VTAVAATVQAFFTERLARQRRPSAHTVAAYRDTLRLLLGFADLDAPVTARSLTTSSTTEGTASGPATPMAAACRTARAGRIQL